MDKVIDSDWTWLTDYALAYGEWTINAEVDRLCEVGMGIKVFGGPRGQRKRFRNHVKFITIGIGAIHVRVRDGAGPCAVRLDQGNIGAITVTLNR